MRYRMPCLWLAGAVVAAGAAGGETTGENRREAGGRLVVRSSAELAKVWAGHPVGFAFAKHGGGLYVGFYDHQRHMVVGRRALDAKAWTLHRTNERVRWDSHNYIAFGFDRGGHLHVAANMHCVPLRYYRTERAGDVASLKPVHRMTGRESGGAPILASSTPPTAACSSSIATAAAATASGSSTSTTRRPAPGGATSTGRCCRARGR